jgi:HSP90 family molecular chaperone
MKLFKSRYDSAEGRALVGNKRSVRLSISINNEYDRKLTLLSNSCGMSKSEMTDQLLRIALDSPNVVDWLQEQYNKVEEYRVRPLKINNKIHY